MTNSRHGPSPTCTPPYKPKAVRPRANHPWLRTTFSLAPRLTALGLYRPTRHHVSPRPRRGASLFELMAAMSAASVVLATSTALVHRTFFIESRSRAVVADERVALRLARQFRTDVHEASTVAVCRDDSDAPLVDIADGEGSVRYRVTESGLLRVAMSGTAEACREPFSFSRPVTWTVRREGLLIMLSGSAAADASPRPKLAVDIVAAARPGGFAAPGQGGSP